LARQIEGMHLRIDSIEQAIRMSAVSSQALDEAGYRVAYAVPEDNLRIGRTVIADSVNPLQLTRNAWVDVARRAQVRFIEIEIKCSDAIEHRRRVETRTADIAGFKVPTWGEVISRDYEAWNREHIVIDTADQTVAQNLGTLRKILFGDQSQ